MLKLTDSEALLLGLGHLLRSSPPAPSPNGGDGLNKLERAFRDEVLERAVRNRQVADYRREPFKFKLGGRTFYTPDFLVVQRPPAVIAARSVLPFILVEVKGGLFRDDARVKIKVAASLYPWFVWILVYREGKFGWRVHEVDQCGISHRTLNVSWIHGG